MKEASILQIQASIDVAKAIAREKFDKIELLGDDTERYWPDFFAKYLEMILKLNMLPNLKIVANDRPIHNPNS